MITRSVNIVNVSANNNFDGNPLTPVCSYDADSQAFDKQTRQRVWLFTVSAGNVRTNASCNTVQAPATGKNVLAVGATENFTLNWPHDQFLKPEECDWCNYPSLQDGRNIPSFSAQRASTASNLLKPDLVAPAVRVTSPFTRSFSCTNGGTAFCNRIVMTYDDLNFPTYLPGPGQPLIPAGLHYGHTGGTSFAARKWYANVTGIPAANPSPALTKAMLINGARSVQGGTIHGKNFSNLGTVQHITHDPRQGFGMLNLQRLLRTVTMPNFYFFDQGKILTLSPPDTFWEKQLTVRDGSQVIRVTLVWTDAASTIGQSYKVANDLTLGAYQSACFPCWYGNNINNTGTNAGLSNTSSTRDGKNNVEEIIIPGGYYATGSTIRVFVTADNLTADGIVPDGSPKRQDFAVFVDNAY